MREKPTKSSNFIVISSPLAPIVPGVCSSYVDNIMESNKKIRIILSLNLIHQNLNTTKPQFISAVYLPHLLSNFYVEIPPKSFWSTPPANSVTLYDNFILLRKWHDSFTQKKDIPSKLMLIFTTLFDLSIMQPS